MRCGLPFFMSHASQEVSALRQQGRQHCGRVLQNRIDWGRIFVCCIDANRVEGCCINANRVKGSLDLLIHIFLGVFHALGQS